MVEASIRVVVPDGKRSEVLEILRSLRGPTEVSKGCRACWIMQDADNAAVLTYLVRWDHQEELVGHVRSGRFRKLLPYIDLSLELPEIDVCSVERIGGIEFLISVLGAEA